MRCSTHLTPPRPTNPPLFYKRLTTSRLHHVHSHFLIDGYVCCLLSLVIPRPLLFGTFPAAELDTQAAACSASHTCELRTQSERAHSLRKRDPTSLVPRPIAAHCSFLNGSVAATVIIGGRKCRSLLVLMMLWSGGGIELTVKRWMVSQCCGWVGAISELWMWGCCDHRMDRCHADAYSVLAMAVKLLASFNLLRYE